MSNLVLGDIKFENSLVTNKYIFKHEQELYILLKEIIEKLDDISEKVDYLFTQDQK